MRLHPIQQYVVMPVVVLADYRALQMSSLQPVTVSLSMGN